MNHRGWQVRYRHPDLVPAAAAHAARRIPEHVAVTKLIEDRLECISGASVAERTEAMERAAGQRRDVGQQRRIVPHERPPRSLHFPIQRVGPVARREIALHDVHDGVVATAPGYPKKSYAVHVVLGPHSAGPVEAQRAEVEAIQTLALGASIGSVATSGPAGPAHGPG